MKLLTDRSSHIGYDKTKMEIFNKTLLLKNEDNGMSKEKKKQIFVEKNTQMKSSLEA